MIGVIYHRLPYDKGLYSQASPSQNIILLALVCVNLCACGYSSPITFRSDRRCQIPVTSRAEVTEAQNSIAKWHLVEMLYSLTKHHKRRQNAAAAKTNGFRLKSSAAHRCSACCLYSRPTVYRQETLLHIKALSEFIYQRQWKSELITVVILATSYI